MRGNLVDGELVVLDRHSYLNTGVTVKPIINTDTPINVLDSHEQTGA